MYIQPALFIFLVAAVFALSLVIIFIITSYNHIIKKIEETEREKLLIEGDIHQKAVTILSEAHKEHERIIHTANEQASALLSQTNTQVSSDQTQLKKQLEDLRLREKQELENVTSKTIAAFEKNLEVLTNEDVNMVQKISKDIEKTVSTDMQEFTTAIKDQTFEAKHLLKDRIENEYSKAEQAIAEYKDDKFKKIDDSIYPILIQITTDVVGKSIDVASHRQLILRALEEARGSLSRDLATGLTKTSSQNPDEIKQKQNA